MELYLPRALAHIGKAAEMLFSKDPELFMLSAYTSHFKAKAIMQHIYSKAETGFIVSGVPEGASLEKPQ